MPKEGTQKHMCKQILEPVLIFLIMAIVSLGTSTSALARCTALPRPDPPTSLILKRVFSDITFSAPVNLLQAPGETQRWYVVEQSGMIKVFETGDTSARIFVDLSGRITYGGEQGLLDMAFHPDFPDTLQVFCSYTDLQGDSILSKLEVTADGFSALPESEQVLLRIEQPYANHNGGQLAFGPDNFLYLSLGDGGSGGDPLNNGQNPHTLLGSILRLDVDGGDPYAIPPDNPFAGSPCGQGGGCPEIYAWGLRNPWRFSFDQGGEQQLFAGDVGQNTWEEVDIIERGKNLGWHCYEGAHAYDLTDCNQVYIDPIHEYQHTEGRCSVTGGYVYRGSSLPGLNGHYLYADYCTGEIWGLNYQSGSWHNTLLADSSIGLAAFGQANNGEVYALDIHGGGIYQLNTSESKGQGFPELLSETGYFQSGVPDKPVSCFVPYTVNAPLWSDKATKRRFVSTSQESIHIEADGDFMFPIGTVLIKEFSLNGNPVETRLFMRHDDGGWAGYTYRWRADGTDADLLSEATTVQIDGQDWEFPGPNGCLRCHTDAAGRTLGPEIGQLNRTFDYGGSTGQMNQLAFWENLDLFDSPLPDAPDRLTAFARPDDPSADLAARSRAYLHSNCANCHRPGGMSRSRMDVRHQIPLPNMEICNVQPSLGDLGLTRARLLAPGSADRSVMLKRMQVRDENQMPPLGSNLMDPIGTSLVYDWIAKLPACAPVLSPSLFLLLDSP